MTRSPNGKSRADQIENWQIERLDSQRVLENEKVKNAEVDAALYAAWQKMAARFQVDGVVA